jgi:RNA polymerase sigma-70 factor (ECF subfamily)
MPELAWLGAVYERFRRELFITAWTIVRQADLAEDAVHTAFVRLTKLKSSPTEPRLYVFRAVRNAAIDLARLRLRRREEPLLANWDAPEEESASSDEEVTSSLEASLERLDGVSREVIELHLHAALTFQEIAHVLDEPLPTVASRYRRAIDKLQMQMKVHHE